ncbi:hypothetical protein NX059_011860 [Plenodomus lindquistii]|nr:hypothetical protein NX059_011860 [Plenodomus lindquistii]
MNSATLFPSVTTMSYGQPARWRQHICGLHYNTQLSPWHRQLEKTYLPMVELEAHAIILATTSRTVLTQTFMNPSDERGIKQVRYTFPLYDGVSVVGFTCHVGSRTIDGEVKEKDKAKAVFKEAVARGETAGLLEQLPDASDVFSTTVGNIPPGAKVVIKITYLGELKHDMEIDGIRYTIPNIICPRYGTYPGTLRTSDSTEACGKSITITVDAEMPHGSFVQKIQSPSHPIAMTMGTTSVAPRAEPAMHRASATLALGTSSLESDFVVQIVAKDTGVPKAILEEHPTIPNHRALMATLVPKFSLPADKPEIVFVCDQSGSMRGLRNQLTVTALQVFLRSLPIGVKFNICSFGSTHSFLWPQSVTYSQQSLDIATQHVANFSANYGGTEMLRPLKATIERRYKDMPLEVMLLTDGEIWNQQDLFAYLNESVGQNRAPIRVFTLGIGNGVSHALIDGIAKAGNGFSQAVGEGETMDTKVVRMLKGALSPHISDYTLEVKYGASSDTHENGFEVVEKVADSLKVKLELEKKPEPEKKPISLFDTSVDLDKEETPVDDPTGEARYAHLPTVPAPKIIQAPQNIPALFAFIRTSVYLLLGPEAPSATPKSVVLSGTSVHGPVELEIPIQVLDTPGETIHQLAAKKAISELEQGRGWLPESKDDSDELLKTRFEGRFPDMVEREAVRLGVQFQVGGKWCSFVAVESRKRSTPEEKKDAENWEWIEDEKTEAVAVDESNIFAQSQVRSQAQYAGFQLGQTSQNPFSSSTPFGPPQTGQIPILFGGASGGLPTHMQNSVSSGTLFGGPPQTAQMQSSIGGFSGNLSTPSQNPFSSGTLFGGSPQNNQGQTSANSTILFGGPPQNMQTQTSSGGLFGSPSSHAQNPVSSGGLFGGPPQNQLRQQQQQQCSFGSSSTQSANQMLPPPGSPTPSLFGSAAPAPAQSPADTKTLQDYQKGLMILNQQNKRRKHFASHSTNFINVSAEVDEDEQDSNKDMSYTLRPSAAASQSQAYTPISSKYSPATPISAFSSPSPPPPSLTKAPALWLHHIISMQSFTGSWEWNPKLQQIFNELGISETILLEVKSQSATTEIDHVVTAVLIVLLEEKLGSMRGVWDLVAEKARGWLGGEGMVGCIEKVRRVVESV